VRRLLTALVVVPLAVLPLAACDPVVPAGQVVYCTVMADPPVPDAAGKVMRGIGWFVCDRPGPDMLTVTVALQRRDAPSTWTTVVSQEFVLHGRDATRDRTAGQRTRTVTAPCATGVFRAAVGSRAVQGTAHRDFAINSPQVKNPCRPFS